MECWKGEWWETYTEYENSARFFLLHCCSLQGEYDMTLEVEADKALSEIALDKKLLQLAMLALIKIKNTRTTRNQWIPWRKLALTFGLVLMVPSLY